VTDNSDELPKNLVSESKKISQEAIETLSKISQLVEKVGRDHHMSEVFGLYVMMSLILNCSVGLRYMQQCDNVCFVHICRRTNRRDELNIQSQTSTLYFYGLHME